MKEYNLIIIYNDETKDHKERFTEISIYIADLIYNVLGDTELIDSLLNTFWKKADLTKATDEYIIDFIKNELKKGTF